MKLPIRATRPINFEIPEKNIIDLLRKCLNTLRTRNRWEPGRFFSEVLPLNLLDVKGRRISEVGFHGDIVTKMFSDSNSLVEFCFNREENAIVLRINANGIGLLLTSISPREILNILLPLFVHELTHLLDHKTLKDARKQEKYENLELVEKFKIYFNLDSEIRAYLKQICYQEIDPLFVNGAPQMTLEDTLKKIQDTPQYSQVLGFLTPANRNRLYKGIITRYQDLLKDTK